MKMKRGFTWGWTRQIRKRSSVESGKPFFIENSFVQPTVHRQDLYRGFGETITDQQKIGFRLIRRRARTRPAWKN